MNYLKFMNYNKLKAISVSKFYWMIIVITYITLLTSNLHFAESEPLTSEWRNKIPVIKASTRETPPDWAVMERQLIKTMEDAAQVYLNRFTRPDGTIYGESHYDDLYEMFYNWPLFYAIGADRQILLDAIKEYNAVTRMCTAYPPDKSDYFRQLYNEFPEHANWFHIGEGFMLFYDFGVADPCLPLNVQRAKRFAGFYMNEDPEASNNYDPKYKIIRGTDTGSRGTLEKSEMGAVESGFWSSDGWSDAVFFTKSGMASLFPFLTDFEQDWDKNQKQRDKVQKLFNRMVVPCDVPMNLYTTGLMTNAYLYTGDEKYKKWVLEYVEAWMKRIKDNNGIIPDNIGRTGKIGEYRKGQWWGGLHGWTENNYMFGALSVAAECATLLSGDMKYLDILRSQIDVLLNNSKTTAEGQLLVPYKYSPEGWAKFGVMSADGGLAHLWHASMDKDDWKRIERVRKGSTTDWNTVPSIADRCHGATENTRLMYYAGQNPDWPYRILEADYKHVLKTLEFLRTPRRLPSELTGNPYGRFITFYTTVDGGPTNNPVLTKGLLQVTMGAPQTIYNGGLLRSRVRYFDSDLMRPGLPPDIAALVEQLKNDLTVVNIVNTSVSQTRHMIIQAGAFGEDTFTDIRYTEQQSEKTVPVNGKYVSIEMPPATTIRLFLGTKRFVNKPSYAFPWHTPEAK